MSTLKKWYLSKFPTDLEGEKITEKTFTDALIALVNKVDFYDFIECEDSLVRERIFEELSYRSGTPYEKIYDLWIG